MQLSKEFKNIEEFEERYLKKANQLYQKHVKFLSNFTSEMVNFFAKMKLFYQQQSNNRKKVFQSFKTQIAKIIQQKEKQNEKQNSKLFKKRQKQLKKKRKEVQSTLNIKKPKTPLSAYFTFFKDWKEKIKENFPNHSVIDLAKMAGNLWKDLDPEEKNVYNQKYEQEKRIYDENMKIYKEQKKKIQIQQQLIDEAQNQPIEEIEIQSEVSEVSQKSRGSRKISIPSNRQKSNNQQQSPIQRLNGIQISLSLSQSDSSEVWGVPATECIQEQEQKKDQNNILTDQIKIVEKAQEQSTDLIERLRQQAENFIKKKNIKLDSIDKKMNGKLGRQLTTNQQPNSDSLGEDSI